MADEQTTARKDFSETTPNLSEGNVGATNTEQAKHTQGAPPALLEALIELINAAEIDAGSLPTQRFVDAIKDARAALSLCEDADQPLLKTEGEGQ